MICGLDEAGRGPLAGPVYAAAVVLTEDFPAHILDDSKKLSAHKRSFAAEIIKKQAAAWGLGWASHTEIDTINILQASLLAMRRAFLAMTGQLAADAAGGHEHAVCFDAVIVDGLHTPSLPVPCAAQVKADAHVPAVMAASILAKTARDDEMCRLAKLYPAYQYEKHKGYPTRAHKALLAVHGPSPIQRMTFRY